MTNKEGNKLALIIAYYLVRFNSLTLTKLGYVFIQPDIPAGSSDT